ncbi:MAG: hypothetical protein H0U70_12945 [Tatlockia sp.]|nr:hypothetical protein [Tatlockia sp.]
MEYLRYTVKDQLKTKAEKQLFSYAFIAFTSILVLGLIIFLFPGKALLSHLINQEYVTDVDYRYSIALLASAGKEPINFKETNEDPTSIIKQLNASADTQDTDYFRLKYIVLRTISQRPKLTREQRIAVDKALVHYLTLLKTIPNSFEQELGMARDALAINQAPLALFYAETAIKKNPQQTAFSYAQLAQIALWAKQCVKSSNYYFLAQQQAKLIDDKRYFFITGMKVLFQCNEFEKAIQSVEKHIDGLRNDELTYRLLTELAVSADKPAKAQEFVLRLLDLQNNAKFSSMAAQKSLKNNVYNYGFELLDKFKVYLIGNPAKK